jgi:hypothetical protein
MQRNILQERYEKGDRNFNNAQLSGENLSGLNLHSISLKNADLYGVNLSNAGLKRADFSGANLAYVNLSSAELTSANLCGANLYGANLEKTNLKQALYDITTCFPQGFDSTVTEMVLLPDPILSPSFQNIQQNIQHSQNQDEILESKSVSVSQTIVKPKSRFPLWKKILCFTCLSFLIGGSIAGYKIFQTRTQQTTQMEEANRLADEAIAMSINATNIEALQIVQKQLQQSIELLQAIQPSPGSLYPQAQTKIVALTTQLNALEQKLLKEQETQAQWTSAHEQAEVSIQLVKFPPYPLEMWKKADYNLREAIEKLKAISSETWIKPQAQTDLISYESKAQFILKSLQQEESAEQKVQSATDIATEVIAFTKDKDSYEISELESLQEKWQKSISILKTVPPKSSIFKTSNKSLGEYLKNEKTIDDEIKKLRKCLAENSILSSTCKDIL